MNRLVAIDAPGGQLFLDQLKRIWEHGDAALPVDQRLPTAAKRALFESVRPSAIVDGNGWESPIEGGVPTLTGDAVVIATSGTTGDPKGVVLTHGALEASAVASSAWLRVDPATDAWYGCLPVAHIGGFSVVTKALLTGTRLSLVAAFAAEDVHSAAVTHTHISLVTTALARIDASRWHCILLGGSAMPDQLPPAVTRTYGLTETGSGMVYDGFPIDGAELRAVDGQIHVRGPMLFRAYRSLMPEGSSALDSDGWFATGDAGSIDTNGVVQIRGRIGDVIVTGAEKVWPDAVERVLAGFAGIREVAVAGRPDSEWGQRVVVWVVPVDAANPPTLPAIREHVKSVLPAYAAPKALVIVDQLPRTAIGKIQRNLLTET